MYISSDGLQAMHQEIVNDGLRRAERRRLLEARVERRQETSPRAGTSKPRGTVAGLVRSMRALVART